MPRFLFLAFVAAVVFEGALRKWAFPQYATPLFVLKDVFLAICLSWYLAHRGKLPSSWEVLRSYAPVIGIWYGLCFLFLLLSPLGINNLIGARYFIVPWMVAAVMPVVMLDKRADFEKAFFILVLVSMGIGILGVVQVMSPLDALINRYAWRTADAHDIASLDALDTLGLSIVPRITGTFSFISPYSAYLQFVLLCGLALLLRPLSRWQKFLVVVSLVLIFANILMTGVRGAIVVSIIGAIPFALLPVVSKNRSARTGALGIGMLVVIIVAGMEPLFDVVHERDIVAADSHERVEGVLLMPLHTLEMSPVIGLGVGETFLGGGEYSGSGDYRWSFDEVRQDRLGVDFGAIGYAYFLLVKVLLLLAGIGLFIKAREERIRIWALVAVIYQGQFVWQIPIYNAVASTLYFASVGMVAALTYANRRLAVEHAAASPRGMRRVASIGRQA